MSITLELCKAPKKLASQAWWKDGNLGIKTSKVSSDGHTFYHRTPVGKWKSLGIRLNELKALKKGGKLSLDQIRERANALAYGDAPAPVKGSELTLRDVLKARKMNKSRKLDEPTLRKSTYRNLNFYIGAVAFDWLDLPLEEITSARIAERVRLLNTGRFPNPMYGVDLDEVRRRRAEILAPGEAMPRVVRKSHREFLGLGRDGVPTGSTGREFVKYLSLVMTGTKSSGHGITRDNAPTRAVRDEVVTKARVAIPTQPIDDDEIAAILSIPRELARDHQSRRFDVIRWQKILAARLALLTGYRCDSVIKTTEKQVVGSWIEKGVGEMTKSGDPHRLPLSKQAVAIIDEARAIKTADIETLRKRFDWADDQLAAVEYLIFAKPTPMLFPSLKDTRNHRKGESSSGFSLRPYGQPSQPIRDTITFLASIGHLEERPRKTKANGKTPPMLIRPHWLRSTLGKHAIVTGAHSYLVSLIMNHNDDNIARMTADYIGDAGFDDLLVAAMQRVNDHLFNIAAQ